ncbi:MAG: hypothetical protein KKB31_00870 [Nanoarchaeota archaeon]|nr:hypothetical protein [Nanoarchaeota archaeon]
MKSGVFVILLLLFPVVSAVTLDIKSNYGQGETLLVKISGNFVDSLQEENIFLYRDRFRMPVDYDVAKVGNDYYVRMSLIGKNPSDYSFKIKNVRYYEGGLITNKEIVRNFTINQEYAPFAIDPGFVITRNNFIVKVQSLQSPQTISITPPTGIVSSSQITLNSGQTKSISFDISGLTESILGTLRLSSGSLTYNLPISIYVPPVIQEPDPEPECSNNQWCVDNISPDFFCNASGSCVAIQPQCTASIPCPSGQECQHGVCVQEQPPEPPQPYCGDNDVNVGGEDCDGSDFGPVSGCANYGFNNGTLSCNAPGTVNECKIDPKNCFTSSTLECTEANQATTCGPTKVCIGNRCATPPQEPEEEEILCGNTGINPGEACDGVNWGAIVGCINWGFNNGTLSCSSTCTFNTALCFNNPIIPPNITCTSGTSCNYTHECIKSTCIARSAADCQTKAECNLGEECIHEKCIFKGLPCVEDSDCNSSYKECKPNGVCGIKIGSECGASGNCSEVYQECISGYCIGEPECEINDDCSNGWECVASGECWPKEEIIECTSDNNCTTNQTCLQYTCLDFDVQCKFDRNCGEGLECYKGECKEKKDLPITNSTKTCPELIVGGKNGSRCKTNYYCNGTSLQVLGSSCCFGNCVKEEVSSNSKWIGWALIGVLGLILLVFFIKYKKTRRPTPNLAKIGLRR